VIGVNIWDEVARRFGSQEPPDGGVPLQLTGPVLA
jgi:hypothetical protein